MECDDLLRRLHCRDMRMRPNQVTTNMSTRHPVIDHEHPPGETIFYGKKHAS
jgi:hypothetical protein